MHRFITYLINLTSNIIRKYT